MTTASSFCQFMVANHFYGEMINLVSQSDFSDERPVFPMGVDALNTIDLKFSDSMVVFFQVPIVVWATVVSFFFYLSPFVCTLL